MFGCRRSKQTHVFSEVIFFMESSRSRNRLRINNLFVSRFGSALRFVSFSKEQLRVGFP